MTRHRSALPAIVIVFAACDTPAQSPRFTPPDAATRTGAIGDVSGEPDPVRRAFDPRGFEPIRKPGPSDWLRNHEETGQIFLEFKEAKRNVPAGKRRKLYLQPLGEFPKEGSPPLEALRELAAAYFGLEAVLLPAAKVDENDFSPRGEAGSRQILTTGVMDWLKKRLPDDAFCALALTMTDLYPEPSWRFVFGQAAIRGRVGVYSFARYDPAFYGGERPPRSDKLILLRSFKVLAHETGHMFGMAHCVFFQCCLNGSNHLEESDAQPLELCPVCLRKLVSSAGFDIVERYRKLGALYKKHGLETEARWVEARADWVEGKREEPPR